MIAICSRFYSPREVKGNLNRIPLILIQKIKTLQPAKYKKSENQVGKYLSINKSDGKLP